MFTIPQNVIDAAQDAYEGYGVWASVTLAQWALESGWGEHMPPGSNNPFGIKAREGDPYVTVMTHEYINGHYTTVQAKFAKYESLADAFDHHAELLSGPIYEKAYLQDTAKGCALALTGLYATDPAYGQKLVEIMDAHNLTQYDQ